MNSIGIPLKLLHEATGHIVTCELSNGSTYRGKLLEAEDNMNIQLKDITVTARDGRVFTSRSGIYSWIACSLLYCTRHVKYRNAPMFRSRSVRGRGIGMARARATVARARGQQKR
ncbi:unnamed protein product [Pneumocystis jirovecii]|uniref:Small nuclear ribonucleoprotein Sm D3 n=1 Tax=Pneumocystis jirovecii TaxID=42068 RepID=L0PE32_PNEJI|nr:unnamed protein product [Pneumocystis jirovecii]